MRFTVHRTLRLKNIDPILPDEEERIQVEGADSFEEATQVLDMKVTERMALWKTWAGAMQPKNVDVITSPAQTNPPQGQVAVEQANIVQEPQPTEVAQAAQMPTTPPLTPPIKASQFEPSNTVNAPQFPVQESNIPNTTQENIIPNTQA